MDTLQARWDDTLVRLALPPCAALGGELLERYAQPHRRFHVAAHLQMMLDELEAATADPVLALAAWFHDAIYRPGWPGNERASAALARRELGRLGAPAQLIACIGNAVLATASHLPSEPEFAPLIDADLAILGSDEHCYREYTSAIRDEFKRVPDLLFRRGRIAFLEAMLARKFIYHTAICRQRRESSARKNLSTELDALLLRPLVPSCS